jgi:hypothetical protein
MSAEELPDNKNRARGRRWLRILCIMAACFIVVALLSAWWIKSNLYASPFSPTHLNEKEQQALAAKLDRLQRNVQSESKPLRAEPAGTKSEGRLAPEPYTEEAARRELRITEKELNALIAKNEDTARRVAIALSSDITLRHEAGKPVVALRGVSIGGVPIPDAWLGSIKNVDLVREFGGQGGFWDLFSKGVEDIKVLDGSLFVKLKE